MLPGAGCTDAPFSVKIFLSTGSRIAAAALRLLPGPRGRAELSGRPVPPRSSPRGGRSAHLPSCPRRHGRLPARLAPMSLLGGYRKKPGGDGYESLQLVESGAEGGGGGPGAVGAGGRSPARQQQQQHRADGSTMDSSGKGRAWGQWQRGQWQRFVPAPPGCGGGGVVGVGGRRGRCCKALLARGAL